MQSNLNRPLGKDIKPAADKSKTKPVGYKKWLAGFAIIVVVAGAGYASYLQDPLTGDEKPRALEVAVNTPEQKTDIQINNAGQNQSENENINLLDRQSGISGGDITTITTDEGLKVTTITSRPRPGGNGAVILEAPQRGQNPRFAHIPDPDIIEDTQYGRLPVYGQDGKRAVDIYARPWSGARGVRIAIVVGGLGLSQTGTNYAIKTLPDDITLAFASNGNSLQRWMQAARQAGHEILLQVPFEPFDYPNNNPGRGTLVVDTEPQDNLNSLHDAMGRITNYTGIGNFMGGRFLSDPEALEPIMRDIAKRGVMFFDDGTSARSLTETFSKTFGIPFAASDMVVDSKLETGDILKKLDDLERIARRNGQAVGVASAFTQSVDAIAAWSNEAKARGIEIVGISALADDPERR